MKAAVLHEFKQPLVLQDVETPTPDMDEVLIKVEACGVCHSDLSIAEGGWPQLKRLNKKPLIPGNEVGGQVGKNGVNLQTLAVGVPRGRAWWPWRRRGSQPFPERQKKL